MEEKEISAEESLEIMQSMVQRAQKKLSDDGVMLVFWGWLVMIASVTQYILLQINYEKPWIVWMLMPAGGIFTGIYFIIKKKKEKVKSHIDTYMGFIWTAFSICLIITLNFGGKLQLNCYPIVIMLYATATFITGGVIRFMPLIIGGALSFPICVIAFLSNFEVQLMMLALSVLVSYIIPGHWLMIRFKQQQKQHGL